VLCHDEPPTNYFDGGHSVGSRVAIMATVVSYCIHCWFIVSVKLKCIQLMLYMIFYDAVIKPMCGF
jgi:hypothetical protein